MAAQVRAVHAQPAHFGFKIPIPQERIIHGIFFLIFLQLCSNMLESLLDSHGVGMEYLMSEAEAHHVLVRHHPTFLECVSGAWDVWREKIAPHFPSPSGRLICTVMSELIRDLALVRFSDVPGVKSTCESDRLLLTFDQRLILRIKKLNGEFLTSNYPTQTSLALDAQQQVTLTFVDDDSEEPFLIELPRVVLGYQLNGSRTSLEGVYIVFLVGKQLQWKYRLDQAADGIGSTIPLFPEASPDGRRVTRVSTDTAADEARVGKRA